ncbi:MAG TPA: hypothetical protein VG964_00880 [Candidatus Saccharimonadales bacterium]|nr:hypothetical protein [Candidatus Saccharimonadales bacterium]
MAEVEVPSEPYATSQPPAGWPKRHILRAVLPLLLVVAVIIAGYILATDNKSGSTTSGDAHLVLDNRSQSKINVTDKTGKQLYSFAYPTNSYMSVEASSAQGEVLLSRVISANTFGYTLLSGGKNLSLPAASAKALNSAVYFGGSHQVYFTDEQDVTYASCPSGKTCQIMMLNLLSGDSKVVADTGAKPIIPTLPTAYPLGVSPDGKTIYVRTLAANKLGKTVYGLYALNQQGKVSGNWDISADADLTPKLSPDAKQVVFKTGSKDQTTINTLDLSLKKTHKASWSGGQLTDLTNTFSWSPDSKKVLFWGSNAILPRQNPNASFPINIAVLDVPSSKITNLQTISDSAHNQIVYQSWLDGGNIVYEQDSATQAYVFSGASSQIYQANVSKKAVSKFNNLSGNLAQVIFY